MPIGSRSSRTRCPKFPNSGKPARIVEQKRLSRRCLGRPPARPERGIGLRPHERRTLPRADRPGNGNDPGSEAPSAEEQVADDWNIPSARSAKIGTAYGPEDVPGDSVWHFTGADYRTEGNQAVLNWKGNYGKDFDGGFEIRMDDAGDIEFRYEFTYNGPDLWVREIGLDFELPLAFDKLSWDRKAEYSYYPDDHIGRPQGEAVAHPAVPQTVPPATGPTAWTTTSGAATISAARKDISTRPA